MSAKKRRGRRRGRPLEAVRQQQPAVQTLLSDGLEGVEPAYKSAAPRGQPPEDAESKERQKVGNVSPGGRNVNGQSDPSPPREQYSETETGILWHKGPDHHVPITNFTARIIGDVTRDDGIEETRHYEISAVLSDKPYRFEAWAAEKLGAGAIVEPGQAMEARVRHAIQVLSRDGITEEH